MELLNQFKRWMHLYFLKKEMKFHHVNRKVMNLYDAKEIGILFDASDTDRRAVITSFVESLRKDRKKASMLGFYNFPKAAINLNFPYFNRKNINWHYEPHGALVEEFIAKKFDILINAYIDENLPLEYVSAMSQATFRIGHYDEGKTYAYDFMVDMKGQRDLNKLMEQFRYYLEMV